jgi:hypothetical protein
LDRYGFRIHSPTHTLILVSKANTMRAEGGVEDNSF